MMDRSASTESLTQLLLSSVKVPRTQRSSSMPQKLLVQAFVEAASSSGAMHRSRSTECLPTPTLGKRDLTRADERVAASPRPHRRRKKKSPSRHIRGASRSPSAHSRIDRPSQHSRGSAIPKTRSRRLYSGPIPRWIDVGGGQQCNKEDGHRRRRRSADPDLLPLSDVAMLLSCHLENAISKGLFDQKKNLS